MAASQRVKIDPQYPTNLFFVKVLTDWKSNAADNKHAYTIKKALTALGKCPLPLNNYTDLKELKGIGVDIATRLDAALRCYTEQTGDIPRLDAIRAMKKGEAIIYLREAAVSRGSRRIPFIPKSEKATNSQTTVSQLTRPPPVNENVNQIPTTSFSQPILSSPYKSLTIPPSQQPKIFSAKASVKQTVDNITYDPELHPNAQLTLIVDAREEHSHSSKKSISQLLAQTSVQYEMRPLAAGDYLWVLRLGDADGNELLLDYIVERKTWDDLKSSIRHSRYGEQKQRLMLSGVKNVVYLVEGPNTNTDRSLEQAMVTSSVENGFLIHRSLNLKSTVSFLSSLTEHLQQRLKDKIEGHSFAWFQDESKKTKEISVMDCFIKQLTVCPRMSTAKACTVAAQYPSLKALRRLYESKDPNTPHENVLSNAIPSIPPSLSRQMAAFFRHL